MAAVNGTKLFDELRGYGEMCLPKNSLAIASLMQEKRY